MTRLAELPQKATEEFQTAYCRIHVAISAERLWDRHLSLEDRARLGGDLETAYRARGTAGMWSFARGISDQAQLSKLPSG